MKTSEVIAVLFFFVVVICVAELNRRSNISDAEYWNKRQQEQEKKFREQMQQYVSSGYKFYRDGDQLDPDGIGSINYLNYEIVVDKQLLIVNLIPRRK